MDLNWYLLLLISTITLWYVFFKYKFTMNKTTKETFEISESEPKQVPEPPSNFEDFDQKMSKTNTLEAFDTSDSYTSL